MQAELGAFALPPSRFAVVYVIITVTSVLTFTPCHPQ